MFKNRINAARAALGTAALAAGVSAHAALPEGVATAISGYETDATTALGLAMAAGVVVWGLITLKRKLGW